MKIRKFFGLTSRSVLEQVRSELGADAVIVANHATAEGIEISALPSTAMDTILGEMPRRARSRPRLSMRSADADDDAVTPFEAPRVDATGAIKASAAAATSPSLARTASTGKLQDAPSASPSSAAAVQPPLPAPVSALLAPDPVIAVVSRMSTPAAQNESSLTARLMEEVAAMRTLLEGQMAQLAWGDTVRRQPLRARFTRELISCGYSAALAREITQHLPDDYTAGQAQQWLLGVLAKNVHCVAPDDDIVLRGGVYALIGPTGVGKTTTTAKLAARCAVRHGSASLTLLTTDSYRVGAQDQLRIYAKILGVNVQTVSDGHDLRQALDSLRGKHLVLIDTIGMSQRDQRVAEQAMLLAQPEVKRLLLLNATAQAETLEEVIAVYGGNSGDAASRLTGCIITKQDEAASPGHVIDAVIRHRLQLHYVSNGQRVPEDLQAPNAGYLVHRSFKPAPANSPFRLKSDELAMMMGGGGLVHA